MATVFEYIVSVEID